MQTGTVPVYAVPENDTIDAWLSRTLPALRKDHYRREDNNVVARRLLTIFQQDPMASCVVRYLNLWDTSEEISFEEYSAVGDPQPLLDTMCS